MQKHKSVIHTVFYFFLEHKCYNLNPKPRSRRVADYVKKYNEVGKKQNNILILIPCILFFLITSNNDISQQIQELWQEMLFWWCKA